jgi:hypothetical protein
MITMIFLGRCRHHYHIVGRSGVHKSPASYLEVPGFKSRPADQLSGLRFPFVFLSSCRKMMREKLRITTTTVRMVSGPAEVPNKHLPNTGLEPYRYISLFGEARGFEEHFVTC